MPPENKTEVLVVGAGPVGLLTALLLSKQGVLVRVIDKKPGLFPVTDACLLHSRSLQLLERVNVRDLLPRGQRIDLLSIYEGSAPIVQWNCADLSPEMPYLLVVPKGALTAFLEKKLQEAGVQIEWNRRLSGLGASKGHVVATIERLVISAKGYIVPEMDWEVEGTEQLEARFVVGADGADSKVAHLLEIEQQLFGDPEFYVIAEVESAWESQNEIRTVLGPDRTSTLWPLPGKVIRWNFQLSEERLEEFPFKERAPIPIEQPALDQANRESLAILVRERAPWFKGKIGAIHWSTDASFQHRCAATAEKAGCLLIGDAAHETNPAGMQSMNSGLLEAARLAERLTQVVRHGADSEVLEEFSRKHLQEWSSMLGVLPASAGAMASAPAWANNRNLRLLTALPATGRDLAQAINRVHLNLALPLAA
jgi:3-(3-hydroxy-phenyl)propionate hydroxylase